jgi:transposase-like protein
MGQILHGSATTTGVVRRAIQRSSDSLRTLSKRYGINPETVAKWKKRAGARGSSHGSAHPRSMALSIEDEAVIARVSPPPSAAA